MPCCCRIAAILVLATSSAKALSRNTQVVSPAGASCLCQAAMPSARASTSAALMREAATSKILDRRAAIFRAVELAQPGDIVVLAGKGHENYQILKDRTIHFDDREVAQEALGGEK